MPTLYFSVSREALMPCEELMEVENSRGQLLIGVPKESDPCEHRVALTPETVSTLTRHGHRVMVERNAGAGANYADERYGEAGARVVDRDETYRADALFKINPPTAGETELMKERQAVFSYLPGYRLSETYIRRLADKRVTAVAFDDVRDASGCRPMMKIMSEIAGTVSVQVASEYLGKPSGGRGVLLGGVSGVSPAEIVIAGAGPAAEYAIRGAVGMGAFVRVFDNSVQRLQRLQATLGARLYTSVMRPRELASALASADALIAACSGRAAITESMVAGMKQGSVIVDLGVNRGGCCETSEIRTLDSPVVVKRGVIHYCVPNIASRVPRTASAAISNILESVILDMGLHGSLASWLKANAEVRNGVYMFNGVLTNQRIGSLFGVPFRDVHLLMAAF